MIRKQSRREWSDKMSDIQNERLIEFISNSKVAFINGQFQEAFTLAKEAIKLDENCADAYQCAANVCMSLGRYEDAIEYYQKAVNCDPNNGNRYFSLGYAQASVNKIAEAMQNFAKADELGLNEDAAGQMYHILGIVNQEFGKLDDALINLKKSELIIPADMDILKRKAVIYGLLDEITNGLQTANQMKLLAPSDYSGYQAAYILLKRPLVISKRFKLCFKELPSCLFIIFYKGMQSPCSNFFQSFSRYCHLVFLHYSCNYSLMIQDVLHKNRSLFYLYCVFCSSYSLKSV